VGVLAGALLGLFGFFAAHFARGDETNIFFVVGEPGLPIFTVPTLPSILVVFPFFIAFFAFAGARLCADIFFCFDAS
jgi:hypothetical protein